MLSFFLNFNSDLRKINNHKYILINLKIKQLYKEQLIIYLRNYMLVIIIMGMKD